jgi:glycosyltransferase involved in cell wall biosynthesis
MDDVHGNGASGTVGPRRLLAVIDWLEVGGAQRHLLGIAAGLRRDGWEVVVATAGQEPLTDAFRQAGIQVVSLTQRSIKHRFSPIFAMRLAWLARQGKFDLIHAHLHSASVAAAIAARVQGLPLVLTHHSMNTWRRGWHSVLGRWADRQADAVIAVASNLATAAGAHGARVRLIPNGVEWPSRLDSPGEIAAARARLGIPTDAYVISYIGRFTVDKNPLLFIEAAARVATRCPSAYFLMLGDGPLRPNVEARARELNLDRRILFAGFQADAVAFHPVADVLTLPSNSEGAPLVVLEAMAAGRPVVATAVGDVPRQIVHGTTGFVVPPGQAQGLADALAQLADPALRARFGAAGRARVLDHFTTEHCLAQTVGVYREALARRGRARRHRAAVPPQRRVDAPRLAQPLDRQTPLHTVNGTHPAPAAAGQPAEPLSVEPANHEGRL